MSEALVFSIDGLLRLRALKGGKAVVELRSHLFPGSWTYCVYRSLPMEKAMDLFLSQARHHVDPNIFIKPIVDRGV